MLGTFSRKRTISGFTLIELLLSVTILATSLIAIYKPLLNAISAFRYSDDRHVANSLMSQKYWEFKEHYLTDGGIPKTVNTGSKSLGERVYNYQILAKSISKDRLLYQVDTQVSWTQSGRKQKVKKTNYLFLPEATGDKRV